jgi:hypothetical protein
MKYNENYYIHNYITIYNNFDQGADGEVFNRVRVQPTSSLFSYQTTTTSPISPMRKASIHRLKDKYKSQLTRERQPTAPALKSRDSLKIKEEDDDDDDEDIKIKSSPSKFITGKPLTATRYAISLTSFPAQVLKSYTIVPNNGLAFYKLTPYNLVVKIVPDQTLQELMLIRAVEPETITPSLRIETEQNRQHRQRPKTSPK